MLRSLTVALAWLVALGAQAQTARPPVFVLNSLDADIAVVDPVTFKVTKRIPTGKEPHHLYMSPDEKSVIVANALGDSLTFLDPRTAEVQRVVRGISDPYHLRFSPDMKWFVTASNRLDRVDIYRWQGSTAAEPLQLVKRIPAPKTPSHLNIDTKSTTLYASLQDSDELLAIDLATQTVKWKTTVGKMPADIYLTADDRFILVGLTGDKAVEVWDVSGAAPKFVKRIATGDGAHSFRAWGDKRHVLVSNRAGNTISKIDTATMSVVDQFPGPSGPDDMELLTDGKTLLVTSRWAGKLTEIDTTTRKVVRQVKVGKSPHGIWTLDHKPRL
ncbi:YncE family protein [Pelomonas cellulosilytica]|uniref:YncE family protein n=1 Tax=Pelomonas cellulosilytica TaxID=2906762 RepID=A0ABS8XRD8_9BURK|nr:YncE family protein [Pelomonas sp. P8]MCE4553244.1 YncE family protein [Pelomonas sp. P8]